MDKLKRCFARDSNVVTRKIDQDVILVPIRHDVGDLECIYTLNEVAARIWELIDGKKTLSNIAQKITEEFEVTYSQGATDLVKLVGQLESAGFVVEVKAKRGVATL